MKFIRARPARTAAMASAPEPRLAGAAPPLGGQPGAIGGGLYTGVEKFPGETVTAFMIAVLPTAHKSSTPHGRRVAALPGAPPGRRCPPLPMNNCCGPR